MKNAIRTKARGDWRPVTQGVCLALALCVIALGGCAMPPKHDPEFAAVQPPMYTPPPPQAGAIYSGGYGLVLFEDLTARQVGDILTIILTENTAGKKKAKTTADKDATVESIAPIITGQPITLDGDDIFEMNIDSVTEFEGEGDSEQSNSLSGSVTVTVVDVLANGNLRVQGEKRISINQGNEYVKLSGIVRPVDISPDNTILSTAVADATISYTGDGAVADSNAAGWATRFFLSPLWPF